MLPELIHTHHNRDLEDLPFWLDLAGKADGPILELGCGTGRVLIPLAQAGYQTIGLDYDLSMLKFMRKNIGTQLKHPPQLIASDITEFNFATHFPLIILPCNTFSTLSRDQRMLCLRCVGRHLRKGGIFAISIPNPEVLRRLPSQAVAELEDEFIDPKTGNPVQVSSSWQRTPRTFNVVWMYDQLLPDGKVERFKVKTSHQLISVKNYVADIEQVGLMVREIYGDFDRSTYSTVSSHLILLMTHRGY
jgi:SAM-dependent methyltransferase